MKVAIALCLLWGLKSVLSLCHAVKFGGVTVKNHRPLCEVRDEPPPIPNQSRHHDEILRKIRSRIAR